MSEFDKRFQTLVLAAKSDIRFQLTSNLYQMGRYTLEFDLRINDLALLSPEEQKIGIKSLLVEIGSSVIRNESSRPTDQDDPMEI